MMRSSPSASTWLQTRRMHNSFVKVYGPCEYFLFSFSLHINEVFGSGKTRYLKDTFVFLFSRKWLKDANEEGSEDERLPSDEGDPKHLTTRRTN